jgi:succinate dehydrogenase / fumarate reductase flavoprotein subunit
MELIDGYPEYMMESIKKVEAKREGNLKKQVKPMSMAEREEILKKYHPDYMEETKREVTLGTDKGKLMYNGIVDLIEAMPVLDPKEVDLCRVDYDVDVLIIGGGGAGTVAALFALESGIPRDRILITGPWPLTRRSSSSGTRTWGSCTTATTTGSSRNSPAAEPAATACTAARTTAAWSL